LFDEESNKMYEPGELGYRTYEELIKTGFLTYEAAFYVEAYFKNGFSSHIATIHVVIHF